MTNEKMLERVNEIVLHLSDEDTNAYRFALDHKFDCFPGLAGLLASLTLDLRADVLKSAMRSAGRSSALAAAKRLLKSASRLSRETCHGAWMQNGKQCLCDGYHAVMLDHEIPGLPQVPDDVEKFDLDHSISFSRDNCGAVLELPTGAELKAYIKTQKAENKARGIKDPVKYDFGENLPLVNAEYLLDMLELLPGCKAVFCREKPLVSGIYFKADGQGEGILLPVRKTQH